MALFRVLGRICLSLIFILSGFSQVFNWQATETFLLNGLCDMLGHTQEMPSVQNFLNSLVPWSGALLTIAIVFQLVGGILLFFGIKPRFAAFLLLMFLIPATLLCHAFWYLDGPEREFQTIMFLKNLSVCGGLLFVLGTGKMSPAKKEKSED